MKAFTLVVGLFSLLVAAATLFIASEQLSQANITAKESNALFAMTNVLDAFDRVKNHEINNIPLEEQVTEKKLIEYRNVVESYLLRLYVAFRMHERHLVDEKIWAILFNSLCDLTESDRFAGELGHQERESELAKKDPAFFNKLLACQR